MKQAWRWHLVGFSVWLGLTPFFAHGGEELRDAAELRARSGLPNIVARLAGASEEPCRVAYLGGSITAAPGWRVKSLEWLQKRYPKVKFEEINAAIGGTGSDLGVFRVDQDVLRHRPDLLFVEFAVNDGGATPERIHQAMEGIVRKTWRANPKTDICFVYTVSEPFLADLQKGKCSRAASAMEQVADHYGIPSIHLGLEAARMVAAGKLVFKAAKPAAADILRSPQVFSTDGVHPHVETGHELYLQAIARSWEKMEAASPKPEAHPLVAAFREDHWEAAKLLPLNEIRMEGGWQRLDSEQHDIAKRFAHFLPELWLAKEAGASLRFRFKGRMAGIYDLVGPDCGQVVAQVDQQAPVLRPRFDAYCTSHRLQTFQVAGGSDSNAIHEVRLTLDAAGPDKRTVLFERNRPDYDKNPAKYAGKNWYAGSVMLLGELAD